MSRSISRRDFLKVGGLALGGLAVSAAGRRFARREAPSFSRYFPPDQSEHIPGRLGRVAYPSVSVFDAPRLDARTVGYRFRDELINIYYEVTPPTGPVYNPLWYRVWGGYAHSAFIQPVQVRFNRLMESVREGGQLTEMTVPFTQPYYYTRADGWVPEEEFRLYSESTHWVTDIVEGPDGLPWYQITDELYDGYNYYVPGEHLRPIPDEELTPIHPDVPPGEKRVEISLQWQTLTAYEGEQIVLSAKVSSGIPSKPNNPGLPTETPTGRYNVNLKMPSKHMGESRLTDTLDGDRALPGVPWTAFFAPGGYAIHGTYWHNNFGWPMSRGCVNMRNEDAKWLFRWMTPPNEPSDWESKGYGTTVIVS